MRAHTGILSVDIRQPYRCIFSNDSFIKILFILRKERQRETKKRERGHTCAYASGGGGGRRAEDRLSGRHPQSVDPDKGLGPNTLSRNQESDA